MTDGDIDSARFGVLAEFDAVETMTIGLGNQLFKLEDYDNVKSKVLEITGGNGRMQVTIMVYGRSLV